MKISNYDETNYDYSTYWKNRGYEHIAEVIALQKLMGNSSGKWCIDIGGSYGRHLPSYYDRYSYPILFDYSLNTLINNKERILEKYPNTTLVAGNVYFLPFKESTFDASLMIRVLHHIAYPQNYISELQRVLKPEALHIQEYANKMNIKAIIRNLLKLNKSYFGTEPYQQPNRNSLEGSTTGDSVFLNFHPKHISKIFTGYGFKIIDILGVSYFRLELLKKYVPTKVLIMFEKLFQIIFKRTNTAPSIFVKCTISKAGDLKVGNKIEDILACPKCKGELNFKKEECICTKCQNRYEKVAGIWDFRVQ